MEFSNINWTDHTWNPWVGCRHVSAECDHCYADFLVTKRMGRDFGSVTRTKTSEVTPQKSGHFSDLNRNRRISLPRRIVEYSDIFNQHESTSDL